MAALSYGQGQVSFDFGTFTSPVIQVNGLPIGQVPADAPNYNQPADVANGLDYFAQLWVINNDTTTDSTTLVPVPGLFGFGFGPVAGFTLDGSHNLYGTNVADVVNLPSPGYLVDCTFQIRVWFNNGITNSATWDSYYEANGPAGGSYGASTLFTDVPSNPNANPPGTPPGLDGSVSGFQLVPTPVPEPATFAIGGLGTLALLLFRRRK